MDFSSKFVHAIVVTSLVSLSSFAMAMAPAKKAPVEKGPSTPKPSTPPSSHQPIEPSPIDLSDYDHLDPGHIVPTAALKMAVEYFIANKSKIPNQNYISVIDFSKHSGKQRFFIVDLKTGAVAAHKTAHGKYSDSDHDGYATKFSNTNGSGMSSVGFYLTAETYYGANGYSLRLDGKSSTNSNARSRAIVIHPANYVSESSLKQGRSLGCPALDPDNSEKIIEKIKRGSLIYAFTN